METETIIRALIERGMSGDTRRGYVSDYASDYGEPGYSLSDDAGAVLLGNWWCNCDHGPDAEKENARAAARAAETGEPAKPHYLHGMEYHYPRTFSALEERGCELEWDDEWTVVGDRAYRTQADSYSWEPSAVFDPDTCEYLIVGEDIDAWISFAVNDPHRCIMSHAFTDDEYRAAGFVERTCELESGWYGKEDNPAEILAAIQERENVDVLFVLSGTEQFRVTFCVYVRERDTDTF